MHPRILQDSFHVIYTIIDLNQLQGHIDIVHFLLERGANLNLTARCSPPVASSTSTVLAVAKASTGSSKKSQDLTLLQEGIVQFLTAGAIFTILLIFCIYLLNVQRCLGFILL